MVVRKLAAPALVFVLAACKRAPELAPMYCEGGVVNGSSNGGLCLFVDTEHKPDGDPATVGTLKFEGRSTDTFTLRRGASAGKYELLLAGAAAGNLERSGNWVTLTLGGDKYSLRSDAPGFLQ